MLYVGESSGSLHRLFWPAGMSTATATSPLEKVSPGYLSQVHMVTDVSLFNFLSLLLLQWLNLLLCYCAPLR